MDTLMIERAMKYHSKTKKYFKGVFACNKLPQRVIEKPACFIINTDPSNKPGEHWVAVYVPKRGKCEYFDSFGLPPQKDQIIKFILRISQSFKYNKKQLQNILSTVCGNYCCEFLLWRCRGKNMNSFVKLYDVTNTIKNDSKTMTQFKQHFPNNSCKTRLIKNSVIKGRW